MIKIKYLMFCSLIVVLISSLLVGACATTAPTGDEGAAEIAALEDELADKDRDIAGLEGDIDDLEADIAALKKPAKVYRWEPATWISAGMSYDKIVYWSNHLNELSDGRIVSTPSAPGAVTPVEEQIEAVGDNTTAVMFPTPSYYAGKFPAAAIFNNSCPRSRSSVPFFFISASASALVRFRSSAASRIFCRESRTSCFV